MAIPTCDRLSLPIELISLVKSFVWHDIEVKKQKYKVIESLKQSTFRTEPLMIRSRIRMHHYICFSNGATIICTFCICGNIMTARPNVPYYCKSHSNLCY
jgi:hypothetical protein